ncbi:15-hydroxyprostaglandin dehydrogenase [Biscogniauxia mediterranea]|nr:15-hydroxyprostaglandin dehydrogenase [Biscogniauxia mediterranea]
MNSQSNPTARKSIVVTGGASGLGLAMTTHFASQGHIVTILDVNTESGLVVVKDLSSQHPQATVAFKKADVSSWQDLAAVFKEIHQDVGKVDIVMANAGISEQGASSLVPVDETEPSQPRLKALDVNLTGTIYTVKLATHYFQKNVPDPSTGLKGTIICTASNAGLYPFPTAPLYAASKAGVIGLVRSLGPLLERSNIQINALAPAVLLSNIAPSQDLFKGMFITPMSTLIKGVEKFIKEPKVTGAVAEIHGENVTIRPPLDIVDEDSRKNLENFWNLGYA